LYVRCESPVTVPPKQRPTSRLSRYVLADNCVRFDFRFVQPNLDLLELGLLDELREIIRAQMQACFTPKTTLSL
jgi:hypothetical protein